MTIVRSLEEIIAHLGAAVMQRSPNDDQIIADHAVCALAHAKAAHAELSKVVTPSAENLQSNQPTSPRVVTPGQESCDIEMREIIRSKLKEATGYEWPKLVNELVAAVTSLQRAGEP